MSKKEYEHVTIEKRHKQALLSHDNSNIAMDPIRVCVLFSCLATLSSIAYAKYPFEDVTLSWEKRVDDLVQRLTIQEVVNISVAQYG